MAPQEVAGLQAIAKAHGGSLTLNPDTGLPEAGFLSSILPLIAGAFLGPAGLGLTAMQAGMAAGALGTVATGSLKKGLMAGFGAYGGAGLASGLMGAGASGAAGAGAAGASEIAATNAALQQNALTGIGIDSTAAAGTGSMSFAPSMGTNVLGTTPIAGPMSVPVSTGQLAAGVPQVATATPIPAVAPTFSENASQAFQGFKNLGEESGRTAFMDKIGGGKGLMQYGLAGLSPVMADAMAPKTMAPRPVDKPRNFNFAYNQRANPEAGYTGAYTGQRTYFDPTFTEVTAAGGGLMDIGPIEAMSNRNQAETLMANGGQMFAEGGETKAVQPVEQDPYYTMSGQSGDAFKYLMGQMPAASKAPTPTPTAKSTGFLSGITGVAGPDGVYNIDTGTTTPWSADNPKPAFNGGMFGGPQTSGALGAVQSFTGSGASNTIMRPYTFDPATGAFTAMPVIQPTAPADTTDYGTYTGGHYAQGGIASLAQGGPSHLGDYSDGGRLLKGPGDGVSDSIPATIADKRPARLADGEFVVPARIVSELGNGSTEAGARKLYAMMDRVQNARKKSIGKDRVAVNSRSEKMLPA
jgi:hypothetical protein